MSALINKLNFVKGTTSWKQIGSQTGIPYARLNRIRKNPALAKKEETRQIRNLYQRTAYSSLRKQGFSPAEATRWSWQAPKGVTTQTQSLHKKIEMLAFGIIEERYDFFEGDKTSKAFKDEFKDLYDQIKEGIEKSPESTEVIFDY